METARNAPDHLEQYLTLEHGLSLSRADPLARWIPMSTEQEIALGELGRGEILFGSGNEAGKTSLGAAVFVALAQGRESLGGYQLPAVPQPSAWVCASLDFKQQILSVQPKYLAALGDWPHKPRFDGETLSSLRIKPISVSSDDPRDWSLITFISAKNLQGGTGFRGNGYHCDEPMPMWLLRELRKMGESGSLVIGMITATMVKMSQWQPLRPDYPPEEIGRWHKGFLRLRAPAFNPDDLDDTTVGNRSLTRADKQRLLDMYANDPDRDARILGLEINTENSNPLRSVMDEIQRQFEAAKDGEFSEWKVSREVPTPQGKQLVTELVEVESWESDPRPGHVYRVTIDTSLGIADGQHDPALVNVTDQTDGSQIARYEGFIGEYGCGVLGGGLSKKWNNAMVDVATTGGYGENCLSGLRAVGCRSIVTRQIRAQDGRLERTDIGFKESAETRKEFAGALIEAFTAARAGHPYLTIRSRADLAQLLDLQWDDKDRIVRVPGVHHGESFVVLGRWATVMRPDERRRRIPPARQKVPEGPIDRFRREQHLPPRRRDSPVQTVTNGSLRKPKVRSRWR